MEKKISHIFSDTETRQLEQMGYAFTGISPDRFAEFMQRNFPGFALYAFLSEAETLMNPGGLVQLKRNIIVEQETLQVEFSNQNNIEEFALVFDRKFFRENGKLVVSHEYLILPKKDQGKETSKKVLGGSLKHYLNMNADTVIVWAGLSAGAYVWARHGFTATDKNEVDKILKMAKTELTQDQYEIIYLIYEDYYRSNPAGDAFPMKNWADLPFMRQLLMNPYYCWHGRLDLKNSEQLRKFEEYVARRKQ